MDNVQYLVELDQHGVGFKQGRNIDCFFGKDNSPTQKLIRAMDFNPSHIRGDSIPVKRVSWDDCQTFINLLNQAIGINFRLPTESEWEFAARGGNLSNGFMYAGSNKLDEVAWYHENSAATARAVGEKRPNELGLYDMSGNVCEWCNDWQGLSTVLTRPLPRFQLAFLPKREREIPNCHLGRLKRERRG